MRFVNKTDSALSFRIANVDYSVGVGDTVDIPDKVAYAVEGMGVKLSVWKPEPIVAKEAVEEAVEAEAPPAVEDEVPVPARRGRRG